jgi:hypothetical protein
MQQARDDVGRFWYTDLKTKELRRRALKGLPRLIDVFWKKKHTVLQFYWWLAQRRADVDMIVFDNPIQSDNMPIKGFPMKYELLGGWTIPHADLKYLKGGPLAEEGLQRILVPASLGWPRVLEVFRQVAPIATTLAGIATLTNLWPVVLAVLTGMISAL